MWLDRAWHELSSASDSLCDQQSPCSSHDLFLSCCFDVFCDLHDTALKRWSMRLEDSMHRGTFGRCAGPCASQNILRKLAASAALRTASAQCTVRGVRSSMHIARRFRGGRPSLRIARRFRDGLQCLCIARMFAVLEHQIKNPWRPAELVHRTEVQ